MSDWPTIRPAQHCRNSPQGAGSRTQGSTRTLRAWRLEVWSQTRHVAGIVQIPARTRTPPSLFPLPLAAPTCIHLQLDPAFPCDGLCMPWSTNVGVATRGVCRSLATATVHFLLSRKLHVIDVCLRPKAQPDLFPSMHGTWMIQVSSQPSSSSPDLEHQLLTIRVNPSSPARRLPFSREEKPQSHLSVQLSTPSRPS